MSAHDTRLYIALEGLADEVEEVNRANGWFEESRSVGDGMALLHSEVSEAFDAWRKFGFRDVTDIDTCARCGSAQLDSAIHTQHSHAYLHSFESSNPKPEGYGSELADVLIRLVDQARRDGIDLAAETRRKLAYNVQRGYRHGGRAV